MATTISPAKCVAASLVARVMTTAVAGSMENVAGGTSESVADAPSSSSSSGRARGGSSRSSFASTERNEHQGQRDPDGGKDTAAADDAFLPRCKGIFCALADRRGFQKSNVENQFEHFAVLFTNKFARIATRCDSAGEHTAARTLALGELHGQLTENYILWTAMTGARDERFGDERNDDGMVRDIALFLMLWGEAANLRHLPEFLAYCFGQLLRRERSGHNDKSFLDLVKPLYNVIAASMTAKNAKGILLSHAQRRNYDDFNEFFWDADCCNVTLDNLSGKLQAHPKTFVEWRSWLRPLDVFFPLLIFYVCALQIIVCIAFKDHGVGIDEYLLIAPSHSALVAFKFFLGGVLDGRRLMRFSLALLYSLMAAGLIANYLGKLFGDLPYEYTAFSYIGVSCLCAIGDACGLFKSKRPHVLKYSSPPLSSRLLYAAFWIVIIAGKLSTDYFFTFQPLVQPSLDVVRDYDADLNKLEFLFLVSNWLVPVVVYFYSITIFFQFACSAVGIFLGFKLKLRLPNVDDSTLTTDSVRARFIETAQKFREKAVAPSARDDVAVQKLESVGDLLIGAPRVTTTPRYDGSCMQMRSIATTAKRYSKRRSVSGRMLVKTSSSSQLLPLRVVRRSRDWRAFAAFWNELVASFWEDDLLEYEEKNALSFHTFPYRHFVVRSNPAAENVDSWHVPSIQSAEPQTREWLAFPPFVQSGNLCNGKRLTLARTFALNININSKLVLSMPPRTSEFSLASWFYLRELSAEIDFVSIGDDGLAVSLLCNSEDEGVDAIAFFCDQDEYIVPLDESLYIKRSTWVHLAISFGRKYISVFVGGQRAQVQIDRRNVGFISNNASAKTMVLYGGVRGKAYNLHIFARELSSEQDVESVISGKVESTSAVDACFEFRHGGPGEIILSNLSKKANADSLPMTARMVECAFVPLRTVADVGSAKKAAASDPFAQRDASKLKGKEMRTLNFCLDDATETLKWVLFYFCKGATTAVDEECEPRLLAALDAAFGREIFMENKGREIALAFSKFLYKLCHEGTAGYAGFKKARAKMIRRTVDADSEELLFTSPSKASVYRSRSDFLAQKRSVQWSGVKENSRRIAASILDDLFSYAATVTEDVVALQRCRSFFMSEKLKIVHSDWDLSSLRSPCGAFALGSLCHTLTPLGVPFSATDEISTPFAGAFDTHDLGKWRGIKNEEARRRLSFFFRTLWMGKEVPDAPRLSQAFSFTTLTPYYSEDVIVSLAQLSGTKVSTARPETPDEFPDGNLLSYKKLKQKEMLRRSTHRRAEDARSGGSLTLLDYLKNRYAGEWNNFLHRVGAQSENEFFDHNCKPELVMELRLWASKRCQTLFRTANGIMRYEKALAFIAESECKGRRPIALARSKFNYVISAQVYGKQKAQRDTKAEDIEYLLRRFPSLRIAYLDETDPEHCASVLIRADEATGDIKELFRVRNPGRAVIGEGKPENQNHAAQFARGEMLQAIDMNQDASLESTLFVRNLLEHFHEPKRVLVGFTEHIFSQSVGSVAEFAAQSEYVFGTMMMRIYDRVLRTRMHYGHPDIFDHIFMMSRGGISKASKGLHLNEDIFAAYQLLQRGGKIRFVEFLQAGKGRDLSFDSVLKFEQKLACGAAEQCISRDVKRISAAFDFFRLHSFFSSGIGFYLSNVILVSGVHIFLASSLAFSLASKFYTKLYDGSCAATSQAGTFDEFAAAGWVSLSIFAGFLCLSLPLIGQLFMERGLAKAIKTFLKITIQGAPVFHTFLMLTRASWFDHVLLWGGAKYQATGRGVELKRAPISEIFIRYARSHFRFAFEIVMYLILWAGMVPSTVDASTILMNSYLIAVLSFCWLVAPIWFNPFAFDLQCLKHDAMDFTDFMIRGKWAAMYAEEQMTYSSANVGQRFGWCVLRQLPRFLVITGAVVGIESSIKNTCDQNGVLRIVTLSAFSLMVLSRCLRSSGLHFVVRPGYWLCDFFMGACFIAFIMPFAFIGAFFDLLGMPSLQTTLLFQSKMSKRKTYEAETMEDRIAKSRLGIDKGAAKRRKTKRRNENIKARDPKLLKKRLLDDFV